MGQGNISFCSTVVRACTNYISSPVHKLPICYSLIKHFAGSNKKMNHSFK